MCKTSQYMSQTSQLNKTWNETERNTLSKFTPVQTERNGNRTNGGGGGGKLGNEF